MKSQLAHIHGGMTFRTKRAYIEWLKTREISLERKVRWSDEYLRASLGKKFQIIQPRMPMADNARYEEWEMHFERYLPFLRGDVVLSGMSLGGVFLAKYLASKKFPVKIRSVYLIAAPFDNSLPDEDLVGGFALKGDLSGMLKNCADVNLVFSPHDDVVPFAHCEKYARALPQAQIHIMEHIKGHFQMEEFPELSEMILGK